MSRNNIKYKYEASTKTIRTVPENYCVCHLRTFARGGSTDRAFLYMATDHKFNTLTEDGSEKAIDAVGEMMVAKLNSPSNNQLYPIPDYLPDDIAKKVGDAIGADLQLQKDDGFWQISTRHFSSEGIGRRAHRIIQKCLLKFF